MRVSTIARMHRDDVTLATVTGVDEYGQPTSTSSTIKGRVVHSAKRGRTPDGEDFTSTTQVQTMSTIQVGDYLTINGVERPVRQVKQAAGVRGGASVTEAML